MGKYEDIVAKFTHLWPMQERAGSTLADAIGDLPLTINSGDIKSYLEIGPGSDKGFPHAISFDGTNYFVGSSSIDMTKSYTLGGWCYTTAPEGTNDYAFGLSNAASDVQSLGLLWRNANPGGAQDYYDWGGFQRDDAGNQVAPGFQSWNYTRNFWFFVVQTWDVASGDLKLYAFNKRPGNATGQPSAWLINTQNTAALVGGYTFDTTTAGGMYRAGAFKFPWTGKLCGMFVADSVLSEAELFTLAKGPHAEARLLRDGLFNVVVDGGVESGDEISGKLQTWINNMDAEGEETYGKGIYFPGNTTFDIANTVTMGKTGGRLLGAGAFYNHNPANNLVSSRLQFTGAADAAMFEIVGQQQVIENLHLRCAAGPTNNNVAIWQHRDSDKAGSTKMKLRDVRIGDYVSGTTPEAYGFAVGVRHGDEAISNQVNNDHNDVERIAFNNCNIGVEIVSEQAMQHYYHDVETLNHSEAAGHAVFRVVRGATLYVDTMSPNNPYTLLRIEDPGVANVGGVGGRISPGQNISFKNIKIDAGAVGDQGKTFRFIEMVKDDPAQQTICMINVENCWAGFYNNPQRSWQETAGAVFGNLIGPCVLNLINCEGIAPINGQSLADILTGLVHVPLVNVINQRWASTISAGHLRNNGGTIFTGDLRAIVNGHEYYHSQGPSGLDDLAPVYYDTFDKGYLNKTDDPTSPANGKSVLLRQELDENVAGIPLRKGDLVHYDTDDAGQTAFGVVSARTDLTNKP